MTSSPIPSIGFRTPPYEIKRAKRGKFCRCCNAKIQAGDKYALLDAWTWMHLGCVEAHS